MSLNAQACFDDSLYEALDLPAKVLLDRIERRNGTHRDDRRSFEGFEKSGHLTNFEFFQVRIF